MKKTKSPTPTDPRYPIGKFDLEKFEVSKFEMGKFEMGNFEIAAPDAPATVTPKQRAGYIATIAALPEQLRAALAVIPAQHLDVPYRDGGWSIRQMVHHVADSHMNAYIRFKLGLTEDQPNIKPYNQTLWAELVDTRTAPLEMSLALINGLHGRWVLVLNAMSDADFERKVLHPEVGMLPLKAFLALYDWHSRHHLAQIVETGRRLVS